MHLLLLILWFWTVYVLAVGTYKLAQTNPSTNGGGNDLIQVLLIISAIISAIIAASVPITTVLTNRKIEAERILAEERSDIRDKEAIRLAEERAEKSRLLIEEKARESDKKADTIINQGNHITELTNSQLTKVTEKLDASILDVKRLEALVLSQATSMETLLKVMRSPTPSSPSSNAPMVDAIKEGVSEGVTAIKEGVSESLKNMTVETLKADKLVAPAPTKDTPTGE